MKSDAKELFERFWALLLDGAGTSKPSKEWKEITREAFAAALAEREQPQCPVCEMRNRQDAVAAQSGMMQQVAEPAEQREGQPTSHNEWEDTALALDRIVASLRESVEHLDSVAESLHIAGDPEATAALVKLATGVMESRQPVSGGYGKLSATLNAKLIEYDNLFDEARALQQELSALRSKYELVVKSWKAEELVWKQNEHDYLIKQQQMQAGAEGLIEELSALRGQLDEWLKANGPGGWIDELRSANEGK